MRLLAAFALVALLAGCTAEELAEDRTTPVPVSPAPAESPLAATPPVSPLPTMPEEAAMEDFVRAFLDVRVEGDRQRAESFLGPDAKRQYEESGLALVDDYASAEIRSVEAVDANSFEVEVVLRPERGDPVTEFLSVGPGPDHTGTQRRWIIRSVIGGEAE